MQRTEVRYVLRNSYNANYYAGGGKYTPKLDEALPYFNDNEANNGKSPCETVIPVKITISGIKRI